MGNPSNISVREITRSDIPDLVALNRKAYPMMAEDNVIWGESHLASHIRVFPKGQLAAVLDGKIVGAVSSLVVDLGPDPLRQHTWAGITDSGYFTNHNPHGDTLYGADVYVDPDCRGQGVGAALYQARRELCRRLNLRRILAGGRIWNYCDYADQFSPEEYVERVKSEEIQDLVLSFQLREGFEVRGVLRHYLRDRRSHNTATLIEWLNPDYKPVLSTPRKVRVSCVQYHLRKIDSFEQFARQVHYFIDIAADYGSDFVVLPELFTVQLLSQMEMLSPQEGMKRLSEYWPEIMDMLRGNAVKFGITIIGGSTPVFRNNKLYNVCPIVLPDGEIVEQPKLHITPNERKWWGISGGDELKVIQTPTAKIGALICYDCEFPETTRYLCDHGMEILFVPYCTDNRHGHMRVRICCRARAVENQIYVAMSGNVGNLPDVVNMDINYGQAAVFAPSDFMFSRDGIIAEADLNEETILVCDLDLDDIIESRNFGTVRPNIDRRVDLFQVRTYFQPHSEPVKTPAPKDSDLPRGDQPDGEED